MKLHFWNLATILLILSVSQLHALDDNQSMKYGIFGAVNYNLHQADFYKLYGIPNCCPAFENGSGFGFNTNIFLIEKAINQNLWLGARFGIMGINGVLIKNETQNVNLNIGPTDAILEHKLTGNFLNLGIEPIVKYKIFSDLFLTTGIRFGSNLTNKYSQVETIVEPPGALTFLDTLGNDSHSRTRNKFSGDIPNAIPFQMALLGAISYELPMNSSKTLLIEPEISYYFPLTELVENTGWKTQTLSFGIAIKYSPLPSKVEIYRKEIFIDTINIETDAIAENKFILGKEVINSNIVETETEKIITESTTRIDTFFTTKKYKLDGKIVFFGVDNSGNEIPNPIFKIEEFITHRFDPLLNYIFFENNSAVLPSRYRILKSEEVGKFDIDSLYKETTLEIYYNMLNVIGKRMIDYPNSIISLVGCNSAIGDEKDNLNLSLKRAEVIRDYLVDIWKIKPNQIKLVKRNLPEKPSTPIDEPDKITENCRVEIYSDNEKILEPVYIEKIDRTANPPIARFKVETFSDAGLKNWVINAYQSSSIDDKFIINGTSQIPEKIDWELKNEQNIIPKMSEPIIYSMKLEDQKGNNKTIENKTLPIEVITIQKKRAERIGDYEIQRFSLILFDFDKSIIEGDNSKIIEIIKSRITPESEIEISGYTDRTGEEDYNKKLSERRAVAARSALKRQEAKAVGIGEDVLLYDNDTPEGRFYCRTINIVIKTPIK